MGHFMHDWTLVSLSLDWKIGLATVQLLNSRSEVVILSAAGVSLLRIPRQHEWGRSVSVNTVIGPTPLANGQQLVQLEIQSGDVIEIFADAFSFPS
jgi:hypothetical protein